MPNPAESYRRDQHSCRCQPGTSQEQEGGFTTVRRGRRKRNEFLYPSEKEMTEAEKLLDTPEGEDQMQE